MEFMSEIESKNNVSFLSLLMAPDNSSIENPYDFSSSSDLIPLDIPSQIPSHGNDYFQFLPTLPPFPQQQQLPEILNPFSEHDYFSTLPDLVSLDTFTEPPPLKYLKLEPPPPPPPQQIDNYSIIHECGKRTVKKNGSNFKDKRSRIRDKMFELSKLMPAGYGKKKTMTELLEVAYKYVKFLQAQVSALETMPSVSHLGDGGCGGGVKGRLTRLTRQQLLQIAVNSQEAQMVMAENELCVVSAEQVSVLQRVELRKKVVHQLLAHFPI